MVILGGVILCYLLAVVAGRHAQRANGWMLFLIAFLAAVQVAVVMHQMYTLEFPID